MKIFRQVVDTTKEFICKRCGYSETDTEERRRFHSIPGHKITVSEDYIGNGEYTSVTIAEDVLAKGQF